MNTLGSFPRLRTGWRTIAIELGDELTVASSLDGLVKASSLAVHWLDERLFEELGFDEYRRLVAERSGLREESVVFITAAQPHHTGMSVVDDPPLLVLATVGLSYPTCIPQDEMKAREKVSTINVVVWVGVELSPSGLLDLYRVVSEAKATAASMLMPPCRGRVYGTISDAVAVAARVTSGGLRWAGGGTRLGAVVAETTAKTVLKAASLDAEMLAFNAIGLSVDDLVDDALKVYSEAPIPGMTIEEAGARFREILASELKDPNVLLFLAAARMLDELLALGAVPGAPTGSGDGDPRGIVADELLATALALYVNGFRGLLSTIWVERLKHRLGLKLSRLPVFRDDITSALIGSILSRLYDQVLRK